MNKEEIIESAKALGYRVEICDCPPFLSILFDPNPPDLRPHIPTSERLKRKPCYETNDWRYAEEWIRERQNGVQFIEQRIRDLRATS